MERWVPPAGRFVLRQDQVQAEVRPLFDPTGSASDRRDGRALTLWFLSQHHYLHIAPDAKAPAITWSFGLYLNGALSGVVCFNPPAGGVTQWLYDDPSWRRRVIAVTRTCCAPIAPFNSESFLVSGAVRLLARLDDRFSVAVAHSDLGYIDPTGLPHIGSIYMASNAFWAGHKQSSRPGGYLNPETGAVLSRYSNGKQRPRPEGWVDAPAPVLSRFLWFLGAEQDRARRQLVPSVQVSIREGGVPVWRRPAIVTPSTRRAYSDADKALRLLGAR